MFGLAIPLLLQQIIDKVLTGNLSSLNVLGTAMIVMALFKEFSSSTYLHFCRYD